MTLFDTNVDDEALDPEDVAVPEAAPLADDAALELALEPALELEPELAIPLLAVNCSTHVRVLRSKT